MSSTQRWLQDPTAFHLQIKWFKLLWVENQMCSQWLLSSVKNMTNRQSQSSSVWDGWERNKTIDWWKVWFCDTTGITKRGLACPVTRFHVALCNVTYSSLCNMWPVGQLVWVGSRTKSKTPFSSHCCLWGLFVLICSHLCPRGRNRFYKLKKKV